MLLDEKTSASSLLGEKQALILPLLLLDYIALTASHFYRIPGDRDRNLVPRCAPVALRSCAKPSAQHQHSDTASEPPVAVQKNEAGMHMFDVNSAYVLCAYGSRR